MEIILLTLLFFALIGYETPYLVRYQMWGELGVFLGLMVTVFAISGLMALDVNLPNPNELLIFISDKMIGLME